MHTSALATIAARCHAELERTTAEYLDAVRQLPGYSVAAVGDDEVRRTARDSLDLLMRLLAGERVEERLGVLSDGIGQRRARQGVALDSLTRAVRMDFRFLWGVLRGAALEAELVPLADEVATVWDAVELHTSRIQAAYIAELTHINRELERERGSLLRRLVVGQANDPAQLAHVAAMLGLPVDGRFRVAVANPRLSRQFQQALARLRPRPDLHAIDGIETAIIDDAALSEPSRAMLEQLPAGLSPVVDGLGSLSLAWQLARRLAELVAAPGAAATLTTHWQHLADDGIGPAAAAFRAEQLADVLALPAARRAALLESVRAYMRSGSVSQSAARLYLHRNTTLKRLAAFTRLTGLDPAVPDQAGVIRLLLRDLEEPDGRQE